MRKLMGLLFLFTIFVATAMAADVVTTAVTSGTEICAVLAPSMTIAQGENLAMSERNLATVLNEEVQVFNPGEIVTAETFGFRDTIADAEKTMEMAGTSDIASNCDCANDNNLARTDIPGSATSGLMITLTS